MDKTRYDTEHVSHSSLNEFEKSPGHYRRYKDGIRDSPNKGMQLGTLLHKAVLEPDDFNYEVIGDPPEAIGQMKAFVDELVRTRAPFIHYNEAEEEEWYVNAYDSVGFKRDSFDKVYTKFTESPDLAKYYDYLVRIDTMTDYITSEQMQIVEGCLDSIKKHKLANKLLFEDKGENEIRLKWKWVDFNMLGILDRLIISGRTATIIDLKTSGTRLTGFRKSYEEYNYYRQLALYKEAVLQLYDVDEVLCYIVAVETKFSYTCEVFKPTDGDLLKGRNEAMDLRSDLSWHFNSDIWDRSAEYYKGDGSTTISLTNG